jgi:hypothetical protein
MVPPAHALSVVAARGIDPTDHGSNLGVVAGLAVAILAFIGILVFLITRWGSGAEPETETEPEPETEPDAETDPERDAAPD